MNELSDRELVERSLARDERAFMALVRRYEQPLANLIRYQVGNIQHAEDLLQETLLQAWLDLDRLRDRDKVLPWLLQVGRNRCRDFFKSAQRRERPTEAPIIESQLNQFGHSLRKQQEAIADLYEALDQVPETERKIAEQFYLEGFTIREIAQRGRKPQGTVKRHLFSARNHMRQSLEITARGRRPTMAAKAATKQTLPFPQQRPDIVITQLDQVPFAVDSPELRWWIVRPQLGDVALKARYIPADWQLDKALRMRATRTAEIHGIEGVEIDLDQWDQNKGWEPAGWSICARQDPSTSQYLAVISGQNEQRRVNTFLEEGFTAAWGQMDRKLEDQQRLQQHEDGTWTQAHSTDNLEAFGAGVYSVQIGPKSFTCLRVIQLEGEITDPEAPLDVNYVTQEGRTVLMRSYCQDRFDDIAVDREEGITVDGVRFFLWEDTLSGLAIGA